MSIGGFATQPSFKNPGYIPNNDGQAVIYPGMFGVVNNIKVGDNAFGWAGDHVEPGVSIDSENPNEHFALHYLVCTGNKAIVRSGEAIEYHDKIPEKIQVRKAEIEPLAHNAWAEAREKKDFNIIYYTKHSWINYSFSIIIRNITGIFKRRLSCITAN